MGNFIKKFYMIISFFLFVALVMYSIELDENYIFVTLGFFLLSFGTYMGFNSDYEILGALMMIFWLIVGSFGLILLSVGLIDFSKYTILLGIGISLLGYLTSYHLGKNLK